MFAHVLEGNAFPCRVETNTVSRPATAKPFSVNKDTLDTCRDWFQFMTDQAFTDISVEFNGNGADVIKATGTKGGVVNEVTPILRDMLENK